MIHEGSRIRKWSIVANQNAKCFNNFDKLIKKATSNYDTYAYILHDKDIDIDGKPKGLHIHCVIIFKNARTFKSMQNIFEGAHLEEVANTYASFQYLLHLNDPSKFQYDLKEIICNNPTSLQPYFDNTKEPFNPDAIIDYYKQGCHNLVQFYVRFGSQINGHLQLIKSLCSELNEYSKVINNDF